jgi:hypothetical protein
MNTPMEKRILESVDRIDKHAQAIRSLLFEIRRLSVEKGNCKDIWQLANEALKHISAER